MRIYNIMFAMFDINYLLPLLTIKYLNLAVIKWK